jgi:hypothetical protein
MAPDGESINGRSSDEEALLEQVVGRFEDAWQNRGRPVLESFLPRPPASCLPILIELIHVDLEYRAKAGEEVRVEQYLERFPLLTQHRALVLELITAEWQLRGRHSTTTLEHYLHRFPQYQAELLHSLPPLPSSSSGVGPPASAKTPSGAASPPALPSRRILFPDSVDRSSGNS